MTPLTAVLSSKQGNDAIQIEKDIPKKSYPTGVLQFVSQFYLVWLTGGASEIAIHLT